MSKKTTNRLIGIFAVIGVLAIVYINFAYGSRPDANITAASYKADSKMLSLYGNVKAEKSSQLGFENGGKITTLNKNAGDFVTAGTILATVDSLGVKAQYQQASSNLLAAQADLKQFQDIVSKEKYKLKALKNSDAASNDTKAQQAQVDAAENTVLVQQAKISAAQDAVKVAEANAAKTAIRAPFDGVVARLDGEIGEVVAPGAKLVMLIGGDQYEIEALVSEKDVAKIKVGDKADVTLDAYPSSEIFQTFVSSVDQGETVVNGVVEYRVTFAFINKDDRIKSGMNANIVLKN